MFTRNRKVVASLVLMAALIGLSIIFDTETMSDPVMAPRPLGIVESFRPYVQSTAAPGKLIKFGDTIDDQFGDGDGPIAYSFKGDAGNLVTITMISSPDNDPPIDPAIQLLDPNGTLIARNDDSLDTTFGLTNARITRFPLPVDGTYTIQAMRSSHVNGAFVLSLKGTKGTAVDKLEYGKAVQGNVTGDAPKAAYLISASQGDVITIVAQTATGANLIPFVVLLSPDGDRLVTSDPNAKTSKSARVTRFLIQDDGTYTVQVTHFGEDTGTTTGGFRLTVTLVAQNTIMTYGDTVQGTINDDTFAVNFIFAANKGDLITITMKTTDGDLDSTLALQDPTGKKVASSETASGAGLQATDAQIRRFQIPSKGNFTIIASRKDGETGATSGSFTLELDLTKGTQ